MQKIIRSVVSLCLAFAMCIGVTAVARTTTKSYVVADAATTTAETYYDGITATSGNALLGQLHDLITTTHTTYSTYDDCHYKATSTDPGSESNTVMEFYTQIDISFSKWDVSGGWNREHVWPKSDSNGLWKDVSKSTKNAGSDLHHIRPAEKDLNNSRGNKLYGEVGTSGTKEYTSVSNVLGGYSNSNAFEPLDNVKGDVARILMYVYTHYNTYSNVYGTKNGGAQSGVFGTLNFTHIIKESNEAAAKQLLLKWNKLDPVDSIETLRNEEVYKIQGNRNPFIDNSSYADAIWGTGTVTPVDPVDPTPALTNLSLNTTSLTLNAGSTYDLKVTATPSGASNSVSWASSDTAVATVANGKVTAKAAGTATITATSTVNSAIKATATVTVKESSTPTPSDTFGAGTFKISVNLSAAADVGKVLYFNGALDGYYLGTTENEANAAEVVVEEVTYGYTLKVGGKYIEVAMSTNNGKQYFNAVLNSSSTGAWEYDSDLKTITWRITTNGNDYYLGTYTNSSGSTRETIGASETRYITGEYADKVGVSQFVIEFESVGGTTPVDPDTPLESIEVNPSALTLEEGTTASLSAVTVPSNVAADIVWTSSDLTVATVSENGTVTAIKEGGAVIKAESKDNPEIYGAAIVIVTAKDDPVDKEEVFVHITSSGDKYMQKGDTGRLEVFFTPSDKSVEVIWSSTDESVVTVDQNGKITAVGVGTAEITATSKVNPNIVSNSQIIVVKSESENTKKFVAAVAKMAGVTDETSMHELYAMIVDAAKIYNTLNADEKASVATVKAGLDLIINMYNVAVKAANSAAGSAEENALCGVGGYIKRGE